MLKFAFTTHFTRGALEGLTYDDTITFESRARFEAWLAGINRNHKRGVIDYFVTAR